MTELVLRARWEPRARTLAPSIGTRTLTPEYDVQYRTDAQGFRAAPADSSRAVAMIGDSFVFGSGAAAEHLTASLLGARNFGIPGTGPFNALYLWRDYVRVLRPGVVVVALYAGNDAGDALREAHEARPRVVTVARAKMLWWRLRAWWRSRTGNESDAPTAANATGWNAFGIENPARLERLLEVAHKRGVPEDSIRTRYAAIPDTLVADALAFRSNPFNLADAVLDPDGLRHNLLLDTPEMEHGWAAVETALHKLTDEVDAAGSKLVLVCIPAAVQVDSTYWWLENLGVRLDERVLRDTRFQDRLAEFAGRENIPLIDLLPVMRAHPEERLYYEQDGHWTPAGHARAAEAIARAIRPWLPAAKAGLLR